MSTKAHQHIVSVMQEELRALRKTSEEQRSEIRRLTDVIVGMRRDGYEHTPPDESWGSYDIDTVEKELYTPRETADAVPVNVETLDNEEEDEPHLREMKEAMLRELGMIK